MTITNKNVFENYKFRITAIASKGQLLNSSPLGQNGRHLAYDIYSCIFVHEKFFIFSKISLKFY